MLQIEEHDDHISFGGAVTWEQALPWFRALYSSFGNMVRRFGSVQVRRVRHALAAGLTADLVGIIAATAACYYLYG